MSTPSTHRLTIAVDVGLSSCGEVKRRALEWLNTQHTGEPCVPMDRERPDELVAATVQMMQMQRVYLTFDVDRDGRWRLVSVGA